MGAVIKRGDHDLGPVPAHWSDCAVHAEPAYPAGNCTCGGLDLAAYVRYVRVTSLIPDPWGLASFIRDGETPGSVEPEEAPASISAGLGATDLPSSHDRIAFTGSADSVDLDDA